MSAPNSQVVWGRFPSGGEGEEYGRGGNENPPLPPGGNGGDNGGMDRLDHLEKRVDQIDVRLGRIEGDVSAIKSSIGGLDTKFASLDAKLDINSIRASVEKSHTDIYKWIVSIIAVIGAIYFGLQRVAPPPSQQAPIIIQVPQHAPAAQPMAPSS